MSFKDSLQLKQSPVIELTSQGEQNANLQLATATGDIGATVSGIVYDTTLTTGDPVEGATVVVYDATGTAVFFGITGATGEYQIIGLADATAYTINAAKDGYVTSVTSSFTSDIDTPTVQDFAIIPNTNENLNTVYGIVSDSAAIPVPVEGATAILLNTTSGALYSSTTTIADGEYAVYDVPAGNYSLKVLKNGYVSPAAVEFSLTTEQNHLENVTLESNDTGVVSGKITDNETAPVNNAFVGIYSVDENDVPETLVDYTFTNSQGIYVFGNIAAGSYIIKAKLSAQV